MEAGQNAPRETQQESAPTSPLPSINLPKGGGAIRGIGEKFAPNPVTGTGSLTVPIFASPDRSGVGPKLSLVYDSGASNGAFGLGWSLSLPSITRKTDKGLPQYADHVESDTFILSGAEDLVPVLKLERDEWVRQVSDRTVFGRRYRIHGYRPRVEGLFARIERWVNLDEPGEMFWRSISRDNITTWFGKSAESRIMDPADPQRIFTWLISETYDDKGNVTAYRYKPEDSVNVDLSRAHECNRSDLARSAKRYPKRILYGNRHPYFPDLTARSPEPRPADWCFELVFDYGDHDPELPQPEESKPWPCRKDPFSEYRAAFEVRTYRLCQRVLMFHHFPDDPNVGRNCLVRSTDLAHSVPGEGTSFTAPYSVLAEVRITGYMRNQHAQYDVKSLPPLEFEYSAAEINETPLDLDPESLASFPSGLGGQYHWVDLDGEGVSGILVEQEGNWFYKSNLSPAYLDRENETPSPRAKFAPAALVMHQPHSHQLTGGRQQLMDVSGNGHLDLVQLDSAVSGFFERIGDDDWKPFQPFHELPSIDWKNPNLKFVDLTGDGRSDLLISEDHAFVWHASLGGDGFGPARFVPQFGG